jgi:hypothetical protein
MSFFSVLPINPFLKCQHKNNWLNPLFKKNFEYSVNFVFRLGTNVKIPSFNTIIIITNSIGNKTMIKKGN